MNDSPAIAPARSRFLRFSPAAAKRKGSGVHLIGAGILLVLSGFCACPPQNVWPLYLLPVPFLLLAWWRGVRWQRWLAILLLVVCGILVFMSVTAESRTPSRKKPVRETEPPPRQAIPTNP